MKRQVNLRLHEVLGLFYQFLGATCFGIGMYWAVWLGVRPLYYHSMVYAPSLWEWFLFPLFFGLGGLLWSLGMIEVKEVLPGHKRRL